MKRHIHTRSSITCKCIYGGISTVHYLLMRWAHASLQLLVVSVCVTAWVKHFVTVITSVCMCRQVRSASFLCDADERWVCCGLCLRVCVRRQDPCARSHRWIKATGAAVSCRCCSHRTHSALQTLVLHREKRETNRMNEEEEKRKISLSKLAQKRTLWKLMILLFAVIIWRRKSLYTACVCVCVCVAYMALNDIIRANESSYPLSLFVCVYVCMHVPSHAGLGTHKRHRTSVDKWRMGQSPTPDATMRASLIDKKKKKFCLMSTGLLEMISSFM